ncbi:MAG: YihY family inner membrane protein [Betaproteobacteria bacterium]|nr:YihY family inner membrane protein [Betaproteobacteria bacterium]
MSEKPAALIELARMVAARFVEERCLQVAASLTFTTLLALVPMVAVALTVISAFPVFGAFTEHLERFVLENLVPESAEAIAAYTEQFTENAGRLTALGAAFLGLTALLLMLTIDRAFNTIWRVTRPRPMLQRVLIYWTVLTVGPLLIGVSLSLTYWLVGISLGVVRDIPGAGVALLKIMPVVLTSVAFALLYLAVPNRRIALGDALLGGVAAGLAFEAMKRGFAFYVTQFPTYKLVYGAFAIAKERLKKEPLEIFQTAIENVTPLLEVRSRRVGGATYQVPVEVSRGCTRPRSGASTGSRRCSRGLPRQTG